MYSSPARRQKTEKSDDACALPTAAPGHFADSPILQTDEKTAERPTGAEDIYLFPQSKFPITHPAVPDKLFKKFLIGFRSMISCFSQALFVLCHGMARVDIAPEFRILTGRPDEDSGSDADENTAKDAGKQ